LNGQISSTEIRGVSANDFRDQRQVLLQELTHLTGATTREETTGDVTVIASGLLLVSGSRSATLHTDTVNPVGLHAVTYETPDGLTLDATSLLTQGEIGSVLDMRDREVQDIVDRLDQLAKTLVDEVNAQHALGFDMQGAAGGDFFTPIAATAGAASTVRIDPAITADPRLIATAATATTAPGDNRNALALANLQSAGFAALGGLTLQDHFLGLVGEVGSRAEIAQSRLHFEEALLAQTQARRESVSGVNIDEEMIKLIQFQRAFEASSLLVRTADSLYDALLLMVR
jgi:flagellar hook-associated protein 1 FlgK